MHAVNYTPVAGHYRGGGRPARNQHSRSWKSLTRKVIFAWVNMRLSTGQILAKKPSEEYVFGLLLMSNMVFFLSWTLKGVVVPGANGGLHLFSIEIALLGLVSFVGRACLMYSFAALIGAACRIMGGTGSWRDTRVAVFWGALVATPFGVLAALMSVVITHLAVAFPIFTADWIYLPLYWLGMVPFLWFISAGVAKVHGFGRSLPLFIPMGTLALVGLITAMYFRAKGLI